MKLWAKEFSLFGGGKQDVAVIEDQKSVPIPESNDSAAKSSLQHLPEALAASPLSNAASNVVAPAEQTKKPTGSLLTKPVRENVESAEPQEGISGNQQEEAIAAQPLLRLSDELAALDQDFKGEQSAFTSDPSQLTLLDLAEILDQHKLWVESGGEQGRRADLSGASLVEADLTGVNLQGARLHKTNFERADLSMANLRGAMLVQANLGYANLLGTELGGANLMGANLYGTEGLWLGRLGGTNLFDAVLPESISAMNSSKAIGDATKVARWFYFLTAAAALLCCFLIAGTNDARLLLNASALPFARLGNVLPLAGFYLGGPLILLVLWLRFHFLLLRLWGNMAALPTVFPDGQTLERDGPWYLMGLVRRHLSWQEATRSAMNTFELALATLLAYWIVPATLFLFWLRYLTRQDFRGTALHVLLTTFAVATATSVPFIASRVLRTGDVKFAKSRGVFRMLFGTTRAAIVTGSALFALSLGVSLGLPSDPNAVARISSRDVRRWAATAFQAVGYRPYADLPEATLSTPPARGTIWTDETVEKISGAKLNQANLRFARAYRAFLVNARLWRGNLEGAYLSEADLRGANLREALLRAADLDRVQAQHSVMVSANARDANFSAADLRYSDLSYGIFENALLSNAKISSASLYAVNLRNAQLLRSDLSHSDLRDSRLEHAMLSFANFQEADLSSANLTQANLSAAQLRGAILLDAELRESDLRGAIFAGAVLRGANLTGAEVAGADFRGALGLSASQVCSMDNWRNALLDADVLASVQASCPSSR